MSVTLSKKRCKSLPHYLYFCDTVFKKICSAHYNRLSYPGSIHLIPRRQLQKQCLKGPTWQSFDFTISLRSKNLSINFELVIRLFDILKTHPKGKCESTPEWSNWYLFPIIIVIWTKIQVSIFGMVINGFFFHKPLSLKRKCENTPEARWSIWFLFLIIIIIRWTKIEVSIFNW